MIYDNQKGKTNVLRDFASLLEYQMNEAFYVSISESIYLCLESHKSIPNSVMLISFTNFLCLIVFNTPKCIIGARR